MCVLQCVAGIELLYRNVSMYICHDDGIANMTNVGLYIV